MKNADWVFHFDEGPKDEARVVVKAISNDSEELDNAGGINHQKV